MKDWKEEMQKCLDSPYYFYKGYCDSEKITISNKYSEEEFNELVKQGLTIKEILDE